MTTPTANGNGLHLTDAELNGLRVAVGHLELEVQHADETRALELLPFLRDALTAMVKLEHHASGEGR